MPPAARRPSWPAAASNICTKTSPDVVADPLLEHVDQEAAVLSGRPSAVTSCRPEVQRPACARSQPVGRPASRASARSTIGMNWMNAAPSSSRRKRYTSRPWSPLAALHGGQHVPLDAVPLQHVQAAHHLVERAACRPCRRGRRRAARAARRSRSRRGSRSPAKNAAHSSSSSVPLVWMRVARPAARAGAYCSLRARPRAGRSPGPSASARRPARRRSPRRVRCARRAAGGCSASCTSSRHPEPAARVQHLLGQEEAVLAVEVADRAGGLGEQVQAGARQRLVTAGCGAHVPSVPRDGSGDRPPVGGDTSRTGARGAAGARNRPC